MKNYFKTKANQYFVKQNEDGTIFLTVNGTTSIENAGQVIASMGGVEKVLARCTEEVTLDEFMARVEAKRSADIEARKITAKAVAERAQKQALEAKQAFDALVAESADGVIEVTYDNLRTVMRYLNTDVCGVMNLPKMSIGYSSNRYDCDGHMATTIILDTPIDVNGEPVSRFEYGAPHGHLTKYFKVR